MFARYSSIVSRCRRCGSLLYFERSALICGCSVCIALIEVMLFSVSGKKSTFDDDRQQDDRDAVVADVGVKDPVDHRHDGDAEPLHRQPAVRLWQRESPEVDRLLEPGPTALSRACSLGPR